MAVSNLVKNIRCPYCDDSFLGNLALLEHVKKNHAEFGPEPIVIRESEGPYAEDAAIRKFMRQRR